MTPAPPRRPRRWSRACTAVVVQVAGVFALAAMVAMPERMLLLGGVPEGDDFLLHPGPVQLNRMVYVGAGSPPSLRVEVEPDRVRIVGGWHPPPTLRIAAGREYTDEELWFPWAYATDWRYREAGLHVLLGDLFE